MADNYLEKKYEELRQGKPVLRRNTPSLDTLLRRLTPAAGAALAAPAAGSDTDLAAGADGSGAGSGVVAAGVGAGAGVVAGAGAASGGPTSVSSDSSPVSGSGFGSASASASGSGSGSVSGSGSGSGSASASASASASGGIYIVKQAQLDAMVRSAELLGLRLSFETAETSAAPQIQQPSAAPRQSAAAYISITSLDGPVALGQAILAIRLKAAELSLSTTVTTDAPVDLASPSSVGSSSSASLSTDAPCTATVRVFR